MAVIQRSKRKGEVGYGQGVHNLFEGALALDTQELTSRACAVFQSPAYHPPMLQSVAPCRC